ncbi:MAG: single-stranded DNA-binding protein [Desulfovibrio sp.]
MSAKLNRVTLIGRMGQDPKLSYTNGGAAVASFSLATDESYTDRNNGQKVDRVEWHRIVAWRQLGEFCGRCLAKGRMVYVEGKLQTRKWSDDGGVERYTTEIVAESVQPLDRRPETAGGEE